MSDDDTDSEPFKGLRERLRRFSGRVNLGRGRVRDEEQLLLAR